VRGASNSAGSLAPGTPLNEEAFLFSYPANDKVTDFLSDYLHKIAEAEVISHELVRTLSPQSYLVLASSVHDCSHSCHDIVIAQTFQSAQLQALAKLTAQHA